MHNPFHEYNHVHSVPLLRHASVLHEVRHTPPFGWEGGKNFFYPEPIIDNSRFKERRLKPFRRYYGCVTVIESILMDLVPTYGSLSQDDP